jgi:enoyl-CoA hydratase/carnithine racemase
MRAMAAGVLEVEREPGIALVTIDSPPLHLVDGPFLGALLELLPELEADDDLRVAVFRSADPDFFLMHGDVEALLASTPAPGAPVTEPNFAAAAFERIHRARFVTIGVLDGAARGGGCEFLSALDFRLGTPRAVIGQPEVPVGILPGAGGRDPSVAPRRSSCCSPAATWAPTRRCSSDGCSPSMTPPTSMPPRSTSRVRSHG